ncbi:MAG: ATP-binding protein [Cyanobacteria bacterium J06633_2]
MSEELLTNIYNAFDPYRPLEPGDQTYVYCQDVRGNDNIQRELGQKISRSDKPTYQLYTGHRGVGKSTELKRLKADLEKKGYRVIYFAADEDIDEDDTQYTDILLACTRHILEDLKDDANVSPLTNWLSSRWRELKDLALTEVEFDNLKVDAQISQFAKLTATLRAIPNTRKTIRAQVDNHSIALIDALNDFISEAKQSIGKSKLVVIADNLDRIVPSPRDDGKTNHDEIFIDRSGQLRKIDCHMIYTVPISLVYSNRATQLRDSYGNCQVLPMMMVRQRDGQIHAAGLDRVKELIHRRIQQFDVNKKLDTEIFDQPSTLEQICLASGGHMREIMHLMQTALDWTDDLPLHPNAVRQAITRARNNYRNAVDAKDWEKLARVHHSKQLPNEDEYRNLLFNRCLLEYRATTDEGEQIRWHDAHPLILKIEEFKSALAQVQAP